MGQCINLDIDEIDNSTVLQIRERSKYGYIDMSPVIVVPLNNGMWVRKNI
jgi:hypothetical protein